MSATDQRVTAAAMRLFAQRGSADVSMSELATEAQVARGTLYRNFDSVDVLFGRILETIAATCYDQVGAALEGMGAKDPALRLATGLRLFIRMAHEDPATGRFIVRFGLTEELLHSLLVGPPMRDLEDGIGAGRYDVTPSEIVAVASLVSGATVSAMRLVLDGHLGWRDAGSATAQLVLKALGIAGPEAREIATVALPPLG